MLSVSLREVNIIQRKNYVAFSLKVVFLNMLPNHRDLRPLLIGNRSNRTQVKSSPIGNRSNRTQVKSAPAWPRSNRIICNIYMLTEILTHTQIEKGRQIEYILSQIKCIQLLLISKFLFLHLFLHLIKDLYSRKDTNLVFSHFILRGDMLCQTSLQACLNPC
jgi:hypothetical protein